MFSIMIRKNKPLQDCEFKTICGDIGDFLMRISLNVTLNLCIFSVQQTGSMLLW